MTEITDAQLDALRALAHAAGMTDIVIRRSADGGCLVLWQAGELTRQRTVPETLRIIARAMDNRGTP